MSKQNTSDSSKLRALLNSVVYDDVEPVKSLLAQGAPLDGKDKDGWTPLMWAVWGGSVNVVQFLINKGASLAEKNDVAEHNALHISLIQYKNERDMEIVQLLVSNGAPLDERNRDGLTPQELAEKLCLPEIVEVLKEAAQQRKLEAIKRAAEKRKKALRSAVELGRDLPYKKSPFKLKRGR